MRQVQPWYAKSVLYNLEEPCIMAPMMNMNLASVAARLDHVKAQAAIYRREMKMADHSMWIALNELLFKVEEELYMLIEAHRILARRAAAAFESAPIRFTDDVVATD